MGRPINKRWVAAILNGVSETGILHADTNGWLVSVTEMTGKDMATYVSCLKLLRIF